MLINYGINYNYNTNNLGICYCYGVYSCLSIVVEQHESSGAEQDPRGGAGACQNAAECHT